jgi:hypothetical protein
MPPEPEPVIEEAKVIALFNPFEIEADLLSELSPVCMYVCM